MQENLQEEEQRERDLCLQRAGPRSTIFILRRRCSSGSPLLSIKAGAETEIRQQKCTVTSSTIWPGGHTHVRIQCHQTSALWLQVFTSSLFQDNLYRIKLAAVWGRLPNNHRGLISEKCGTSLMSHWNTNTSPCSELISSFPTLDHLLNVQTCK